MSSYTNKLYEPGICRIFFSSPLNGMEEEREELTRRYWPQIQSLCSSKGIQFVPVDMRWGITSELSDDAQTINICLREIDRSDMFIGFFGQRYGWHGENDQTLQKNFDTAVPRYPWLDEYRDKSVTELEFLHGHLRNPGKLPAFICFRDKAWDDKWREEGLEKGDKQMVYKYSSESDHATELMNDLKQRVKVTQEDGKCLAVHMAYPDPEEGARLMFKAILTHLTEVLLKKDETPLSDRALAQTQHDAFCETWRTLFLGGEAYIERLNQHVSNAQARPLLLVGASGIGKTAILSNWLKVQQDADPDGFLVYHFVEATTRSRRIKNILLRLNSNLSYQLARSQGNDLDTDSLNLGQLEVHQLVNNWEELMIQIVNRGQKVTLIIDGLNGIDHDVKIYKPYHWIPETLPDNVHLICATRDMDKVTMEELVTNRDWETCTVATMELTTRRDMCKAILMVRGKELSPHQMEKIVETQQTQNPLFLKIMLEELCNFGRFRDLDKKMDSMTSAQTSKELFEKVLERCEKDYNTKDWPGNMVAAVLGALWVSRQGLSETEIQELLDVPANIWTPLYYSLEKFLVNRLGFLSFAHEELKQAVFDKYVKDDGNRKLLITKQINYFERKYEEMVKNDKVVPEHYKMELPWLCRQCGDRQRLIKTLVKPTNFEYLLRVDQYMLLEHIQWLDMASGEFIQTFTDSVHLYQAHIYSECDKYLEEPTVASSYTLNAISNIVIFLKFAHYYKLQEHFLLWLKRFVEINKTLDQEDRDARLRDVTYDLASMYTELREWQKALDLHMDCLKYYESIPERTSEVLKQMGHSYHGVGTAYTGLEDFNKATECYHKSIDVHSRSNKPDAEINITKCHAMLADASMKQGQYNDAIQQYTEVVKMEEKLNHGKLLPEMSYTLTNLGICYRKIDDFDSAKKVYERAMKIKVNAYGWYHADVAMGLVNTANLHLNLHEFDKSAEILKQAIDIYEHLEEGDIMMALMAKENLCLVSLNQGKEQMLAAEPYFWQVFDIRCKKNELDKALKPVQMNYLQMFMSDIALDKVRKLAETYVKVPVFQDPAIYCYLAYVDHHDPVEGSTEPRPYEESMDFCFEKFPHVQFVCQTKIEFDLIPKRDLDGIMKALSKYYEASGSDDPAAVFVAADLSEKTWPEGRTLIQERSLEIFPDHPKILTNLALLSNSQGNVMKSITYFERLMELDPENYNIVDALMVMYIGTKNVDKATQWLNVLETNCANDDFFSKKISKYMESLKQLKEEESSTS